MSLLISITIVLVLVLFYTSVGYMVASIKNKAVGLLQFDHTFIGSLLVVIFYALFKSNFSINSITITLLPVLCYGIFLFRGNDNKITKRYLLFFGVSFFILSILNYLLYFRNGVIFTGYKDHSFYHIVASNINLFGLEYVQNVHAVLPQSSGIYHYWDLWHLSFIYDLCLIFDLNCFESYVLVHKVLFVTIVGFGVFSLINMAKVNLLFCAIAFTISLINVEGEFNILIHPKNYINFCLILFITSKIKNCEKLDVALFLFVAVVGLFYNPLPSVPIVAAVGFFVIYRNWKKLPMLILVSGAVVIGFLILYFKIYFPPIAANNPSNLKFDFLSILRHFFIYNGYHWTRVNFWLILIIFILYIKGFLNPNILGFYGGLVLLGFIFSSLLSKHFEQFQFNNNNGFLLSLLMIFGIQNGANMKFKLALMILLLVVSLRGFFYRLQLPYYRGFEIDKKSYILFKQNRKLKIKRINIPYVGRDCAYNDSDFLFSIKNEVPLHTKVR